MADIDSDRRRFTAVCGDFIRNDLRPFEIDVCQHHCRTVPGK